MGVFSHSLRNFPQSHTCQFCQFQPKISEFNGGISVASPVKGKSQARAKSSGLLLANFRENWRTTTMTKDDRDILELLKSELSFIEEGGYGRSVRTPWLPKSIFQDSLSCLNYGYPYRAHPCAECHLLDFVRPEDRSQTVPCHFIPLNEAGNTIEELEMEGNEAKMESAVKSWLQGKISQIEAKGSKNFWQNVD
jgi:hypothetical protein